MAGKSKVDVLVVGAGPVGMTVALSLARRGAEVRIVDRADRTNQESYGLALHSDVIKMFADLGLGEELLAAGRKVDRVVFYENERPVAQSSLAMLDVPHPYTLVIPQGQLEPILLRRLVEAGIDVEWGTELTDFHVEKDTSLAKSRVSRLREMPQGYAISDMRRVETSHEIVTSSHIVGTDGVHSTVRRLLPAEVIHFDRPRFFGVFEFETAQELADEHRLVLTGDRVSALWPMPHGRARWTFEVDPARPALPDSGELQALVQERAPWFSTQDAVLRWSGRVSFAAWHADRFASGPVWLAGDAGHQTMPFGVQSMNGGLMEGAFLASILVESDKDIEAQAKEYSEGRRSYWNWLLDPKAHASDLATGIPYLASHAERILSALPASGASLRKLYHAIKMLG